MHLVSIICPNPQTYHTGSPSMDKDQVAEVFVAGDKDSFLIDGNLEQLLIWRP